MTVPAVNSVAWFGFGTDRAQGADAAKPLGPRRVVPARYDTWAHFKEGRQEIEAAFAEAGPADRLDFAR